MLGTYTIKIHSKDRRKSSAWRKKLKLEEIALSNLADASFRALAPPRDERKKAIRCHCTQTGENQSREVEKCRIHKALRIFYR